MCMRLPSGQRRSCANSSSPATRSSRAVWSHLAPPEQIKALILFFGSFAGGGGAAAKLSPALGFNYGHVDFPTLPPQLFPTRIALPTRGLQPCLAECAKCTTRSVEVLVTFAKRCGAFTASCTARKCCHTASARLLFSVAHVRAAFVPGPLPETGRPTAASPAKRAPAARSARHHGLRVQVSQGNAMAGGSNGAGAGC